jgi:hypothetical protein
VKRGGGAILDRANVVVPKRLLHIEIGVNRVPVEGGKLQAQTSGKSVFLVTTMCTNSQTQHK